MYEEVTIFPQGVARGGGSDVTFRIPIGFERSVDASNEYIMSDVKFPAFVQ
jgi:hypothetical protein